MVPGSWRIGGSRTIQPQRTFNSVYSVFLFLYHLFSYSFGFLKLHLINHQSVSASCFLPSWLIEAVGYGMTANSRYQLRLPLLTSHTFTEHLRHAGPCPGPGDTSHRNPCPCEGRLRINPINLVDARVKNTREKSNAGKGEGEHQRRAAE